MAKEKRLIVGLGNPGSKYRDTRHNIGFEVVHALGRHLKITLQQHPSKARLGWGTHQGVELGLAMPLTYMNRSGQSVVQLVNQYDLALEHLLVVVDDLHLNLGAIRMRPDGSAGGHNGVQDIIDRLGTDAFPRLRIGIGNDFPPGGQVDHVLAPFAKSERPVVEETIQTAKQSALTFVTEGLKPAMSQFNRRSG